MKHLLFLFVLLPVLLAGPALAVAPSTMSYQGVLMDNGGALVPDGNYSLTFKLYTVASGGAALWTETQNPVAVSRGGFSVILGSAASLSGVAFDVPYWLGITVGAGTEMTPRVQLASSPYGLSLRLPFAGGFSSASPALAITNPGGGPAITADPLLTVGTPSRDGEVRVYENGVVGASIGNWSPFGGCLHLMDSGSNQTMRLEPDVDGSHAGFLLVGNGFWVDGNNGSGSSTVYIGGAGGSTYFQTDAGGNAAVQLPGNAVSASEILDEPGVAQGHVNGTVYVTIGSTMADIVTVTLTTPADGYIVVEANAEHVIGGGATATTNYAYVQIDETAGGGFDATHAFASGYSSATAGTRTGYTEAPICVRRTYYKAAGTYTFRLEACGNQNESLLTYFYNPTIAATFCPTGYGTVATAVTPEEASRFSNVQRTTSAGQLSPTGDLQPTGSGESALVDLRELELRATQERLEAEQAQRRLIEARLAQQLAKAPKPALTKP
jgi:hypothetical protein